MNISSVAFCLLFVSFIHSTLSLAGMDQTQPSRRGFFVKSLAALLSMPIAVRAQPEETFTNIYFGNGCFWHSQYEFVKAEREILGRSDMELTTRTGYAGGTSTDKEGRVCYHNLQRVADYGRLGHGEVVGLKVPREKIGEFAKVYFTTFDPKTKERVDPQDRGGEYRYLVGLPGGKTNDAYPAVEAAASQNGFKLVEGKGNEGDTLGKGIIYVYDSNKFPFYQAEVYHQFHNDFQSAPYGKKYNAIADSLLKAGKLTPTGCPDRV